MIAKYSALRTFLKVSIDLDNTKQGIVYTHASDYIDTMSNSHVKEKSSPIHFQFQFLI